MNNIVDFIVNNYIWFIVGGIVVILTIIGYFAEKSDFLAKKRVVSQEDSKESAPVTVDENKEGRGLRDIVNSHKDKEEKVEENVIAPLTDTPTPVDTPVSDVPQELFAPINAASVPVAGTPVVDAPLVEAPVVETPVDTPVVEESAPVLDTPITEPVVETPVVDTPVIEAPVVEAPVVDTPVEEPVVEATEPVTETVEPVVETPVVEAPVVETPVETPVVEPVMETPIVEAPVTEPVMDAPVIDTPVVDVPVVEANQDITPDMIPQVEPVEDMNVSIDVTPKELDPASLTTEELYTPDVAPVVEEEKDLTNAEFEKMFPDDPIIINESQQPEEKAPVETPVETPEDVWKF